VVQLTAVVSAGKEMETSQNAGELEEEADGDRGSKD